MNGAERHLRGWISLFCQQDPVWCPCTAPRASSWLDVHPTEQTSITRQGSVVNELPQTYSILTASLRSLRAQRRWLN